MYDSPKAYFMHIASIYAALMDVAERIDRYRDLATRITGSLGGVRVQRDPEYSRVEAAVVAMDGLMCDAEHMLREYRQEIVEAEDIISTLQSPVYQRLLRLRYLGCISFNVIRERLGLADIKYVFRLHGCALQAAEPALRERKLIK